MYYNVIVNARKPLQITPGINKLIAVNNSTLYSTNAPKLNKYVATLDAPTLQCQIIWEQRFRISLNWSNIWNLPILFTKDTKCRETQWKILHRIYPTNIFLQKIKIRNEDKCEYCNTPDTLEHFFCTCSQVTKVWKYIEDLASANHGKRIVLSNKDKLLGCNIDHPGTYVLINKLILIAKVSISKFKKSTHPNLTCLFEFECRIRNVCFTL